LLQLPGRERILRLPFLNLIPLAVLAVVSACRSTLLPPACPTPPVSARAAGVCDQTVRLSRNTVVTTADGLQFTVLDGVAPLTAEHKEDLPPPGDRWVAVVVQARNVGTQSLRASPAYATLRIADGHVYETSTFWQAISDPLGRALLPGDVQEGAFRFQVPTGARVTELRYDGGYSGGLLRFTVPGEAG
jgi:hypothetical protein